MISVAVILAIIAIIIILHTSNLLRITYEKGGIKVQEDALEAREIHNDRIGEIADK